jgi:DNA (cytosine-5)-methyltransferase 1
MTLTFGSLFAGVGGFDLGFEAAGYDCKFQVEWDKHCQQTLAYHWPDVPRWGDVSEVSGYDLPPVDVITYGFPCQDLSVAGKRAGLDGDRSGLFFEAIRIIKEMREATNGLAPTFAVAENVVGLLNADGGSAMARCLDTLAEAGALAQEWCVLDSQWFGVPQRRRRVFLTACFDPATTGRCPDQIFPVAKSGARNPAESNQERENVTRNAGSSTTESFRMLGFGHYEQGGTSSAIKARDHKDATDLVAFVKVVRSGARDKDGNLPAGVWREEQTNPTLTQFDQGDTRSTTAIVFHPHRSDGARIQGDTRHTLTAYMGTGGLNTPMVAQPIPMQDGTKFASQNGIGVGKEGDPMYTLDTISQNAVAQPIGFSHTQGLDAQPSTTAFPTLRKEGSGHAVAESNLAVRRLTPLECERLMGWPDNHTLHRADGKTNSDSARYKMCGNGVVAPVSAWVAKHLAALLQK